MAPAEVNRANRQGWRVARVAFAVATFGWGVGFYGPAVYLQALHELHGWSISTISTAVSAHFLMSAALIAWLPDLHRRAGMGRVTLVGAFLAAAGAVAWGRVEQPWQLAAAVVLSAAGWAATSGAALNAIVAPWFTHDRPRAISFAFNGASVGGILFTPLWSTLIARLGFSGAAVIIALAMVAVVCPLVRAYLWGEPAGGSASPQASPTPRRHLLHQRRFLTISAAFALGLFAQIGLFSHLIARLVPDVGTGLAAASISLAAICAIVGRTMVGRLMAKRDPRLMAAANLVTQAAGTLLLTFGAGIAPLAAGCVLFGLGVGNLTSLPPLIAQHEFRPLDVGTVVALVTAINQAVFALAPAVLGWLKDCTAHYMVPFVLAAAAQILAAIIVAAGRPSR